jgi:predicted O-methyltransferase YrrM
MKFKYQNFEEIVKQLNDICQDKLEIINHAEGNHIGIKLVDKGLPISINEAEYNFMQESIEKHNLQFGFELSTGIGISTLALAKGFKRTRGHLISLDSYYEELNSSIISSEEPIFEYNEKDIENIKLKGKAFNNTKKILNHYGLSDYVDLEVGWSPIDSIKLIKNKNKKLDFIFLDCPKSDKEFQRDIVSLRPFISDKYLICIHDTHTFTERSNDLVKDLFNTEIVKIYEYFQNTEFYSKRYYPLGVITNLNI